MICISCGAEKEPEEFPLRGGKYQRKTVCRTCDEKRLEAHRVEGMLKKREKKIEILTIILRDTIELYDAKDGKGLRLCIERAKAEMKNVHMYKEG
jgi:hypothetical protein